MYEDYTGTEFLRYMAAVKGISGKEAAEQISSLLKVVHLWEKRNKKIGGYSGGMKQRIMLAQALLGKPELLILDEPTAGLDPQERINIRNYIAELSEKMIVLFATHVVSDIECIAQKVILMKNGRIVRNESPIELITGISGKVGMVSCGYHEISSLQKKYCTGNVQQTADGLKIKIISNHLPADAVVSDDNISLEEVYLYYNEYMN
jgi:ABC-type multidrug transport system ATPase subunit